MGPEPRVHYLFHPSSTTWQYIVADPHTSHCIVIDPVMDGESSSTKGGLSTITADGMLNEIKQNKYKVDHIVETKCHFRDKRSAAWYMRMQLLETQGYAPQVSSGQAAVERVGGLFARKYGKGLQTSLNDGEQLQDGQPFPVGEMTVTMINLPGVCAPHGRMFIIEDTYVFGAHEIVLLRHKMQSETFERDYPLQTMSENDCHDLWISVQKVLSMPTETLLYFSRGTAADNERIRPSAGKSVKFEGDEGRLDGWSAKGKEKTPLSPFSLGIEAKTANKDIPEMSREFMERWAQVRGVSGVGAESGVGDVGDGGKGKGKGREK